MPELFLLFYLGYKNNVRAKTKGLNGMIWAFFTGLSFLAGYLLGMIFIFMIVLRNKISIPADATRGQYEGIAHQMTQEFVANPLLLFTLYFFGFGGYLLVRYLIDQKPGKNDGPVHWMDKLNNESHQN